MKKLLLLVVAVLAAGAPFAQVSSVLEEVKPASAVRTATGILNTDAHKTAQLGDTTLATHNNRDTIRNGVPYDVYSDYAAPYDSGHYYGVNFLNIQGFARGLNLSLDTKAPLDTSVQFLGWFSRWGGTIDPNSTKKVTFNFWNKAFTKTRVLFRSKYYVYGKPSGVVASRTIDATSISTDGTPLVVYATSPISGINYQSYVGATYSYSWSGAGNDTFGAHCVGPTDSEGDYYQVEYGTGDTLVTSPVMLLNRSNAWITPRFDLRRLAPDPVIAAIVRFDLPASVEGVKANELTVFGAFPNPSATIANFKFSLKSGAGVKFGVYDYSGRLITFRDLGQLPAGEQIVPQNVENLPNGAYIFSLETTNGDALATMVDVKH